MIFVVKLFRFKMFLHFYKTGIQKLKNYNRGQNIYWDNYEKRYFFGSHKQLKILLREYMVKLKIISLYIFKDLRLRSSESHDHYHVDGYLVPSPR